MIFRLDLKKHLYDRHTGSPRDQGIVLSENPKTNSRQRPSRDFASIKSLPKRFLSAAMVADICFKSITTFTAMCLSGDRLFFSRENRMTSWRNQDVYPENVSAEDIRSFFTV